jgi:hypothetical protein
VPPKDLSHTSQPARLAAENQNASADLGWARHDDLFLQVPSKIRTA